MANRFLFAYCEISPCRVRDRIRVPDVRRGQQGRDDHRFHGKRGYKRPECRVRCFCDKRERGPYGEFHRQIDQFSLYLVVEFRGREYLIVPELESFLCDSRDFFCETYGDKQHGGSNGCCNKFNYCGCYSAVCKFFRNPPVGASPARSSVYRFVVISADFLVVDVRGWRYKPGRESFVYIPVGRYFYCFPDRGKCPGEQHGYPGRIYRGDVCPDMEHPCSSVEYASLFIGRGRCPGCSAFIRGVCQCFEQCHRIVE